MAQHSVTAIIYDKRNRVLSVGQNSYVKTHPLQAKYAQKFNEHKVFLHAEVAAIVKCKDLSRAHRISVFRFNKDGTPANAKPCVICQSAIKAAGIELVDHT
jgi:deoxycytidylate deaminase